MSDLATSYYDSIPQWSRNKTAVCDRMVRSHGPIKLILKTKDEDFLLSRWINYYSSMVGVENLIIFDNESTSQNVKAIYAHYGDALNVVRFDHFVDCVHDSRMFPEFYEALRSSTKYFGLIDTDEFLIWVKEDCTFLCDSRVAEMIAATPEPTIFPSLWLGNLAAYTNRVWFPADDEAHLVNCLKWGKPIVESSLKTPNRILHNIELINSTTITEIKTNCFLLHLNRLSPKQRVGTNLNKLRSHGVLQTHEGLKEALQLESDQMKGSLKAVVQQIKSFSDEIEEPIDVDRPLVKNAIELSKDGLIRSNSPKQLDAIQRYITENTSFLKLAFGAVL